MKNTIHLQQMIRTDIIVPTKKIWQIQRMLNLVPNKLKCLDVSIHANRQFPC